jgi:anti-sigma factor RsiW
MADHLTDVPTSDQHTVKPWLSARLPLSPVVKDLAAEGFPLVGGRLDYVEGRPAFATAGPADSAPSVATHDGFNVVRWRMGGLSYVAVSDVEPGRLLTFARLTGAD